MKTLLKQTLFTALCLTTALTSAAYDFEYEGGYYNILSSTECEITARALHFNVGAYKGDFTIPESVMDSSGHIYKVVGISDNAFEDCSSLTGINIPNSVTSIGDFAFWYCSSLTSVNIPNSVTSIGEYAFYECSGLTSVNIPNSVTSISAGALGGGVQA